MVADDDEVKRILELKDDVTILALYFLSTQRGLWSGPRRRNPW
jgi:hypothetical protein